MSDDLTEMKALGNEGQYLLQAMNGQRDWSDFQFAVSVWNEALGYVPFGDGPNRLSDEQIAADLPKVEGMLGMVKALSPHVSRTRTTFPKWKSLRRVPAALRQN